MKSSLVYVTHKHEIADLLKSNNVDCDFLQTELDEYGKPTRQLVPGISMVSGAEEAAKQIKFSHQDRIAHLTKRGYLKE